MDIFNRNKTIIDNRKNRIIIITFMLLINKYKLKKNLNINMYLSLIFLPFFGAFLAANRWNGQKYGPLLSI
jgi:hypothetical protein